MENIEIVNEVLQWLLIAWAVYWLIPGIITFKEYGGNLKNLKELTKKISSLEKELKLKKDKPVRDYFPGSKHEFGHNYD